MKKFLIAVLIAVMFVGCSNDDDKGAIESRIESLENSINNGTFEQFESNFHDDTSYIDGSFDSDDFTDLRDNGVYDFKNYNISVEDGDSDAGATCQTFVGIQNVGSSVFEMRKSGESWLILKWTEDGSIRYQNKFFRE